MAYPGSDPGWNAPLSSTVAKFMSDPLIPPPLRFEKVQFLQSAPRLADYPDLDLPEVAVAGRSNVGKSSLLNSLFNRRQMARVSRTPGRTQLLNFFLVDERLVLVDLPGYGFAQVPEAIRRRWRPMVETYLTHRPNLVACLILLDIRRDPSPEDLDLLDWCHQLDLPPVPLLTKSDKLSAQKGRNRCQQIARALEVPHEALLVTSATTHKGRERLRQLLNSFTWNTQEETENTQQETE